MRWDSRKSEVDGLATASTTVDLGEPFVGAGEADLESFDLAEPAFALGLGDAGSEVVADLGEAGPAGRFRPEVWASEARSWMQGLANSRPQLPTDSLHRSKWSRNSSHSSSVRMRYSSVGRSARAVK